MVSGWFRNGPPLFYFSLLVISAFLTSSVSAEAIHLTSEEEFRSRINTYNAGGLIFFYMNTCRHCVAVKKDFDALASDPTVHHSVWFRSIDCVTHGRLCTINGIKGVPTVKYWIGQENPKYEGEKTLDAMRKFVAERMEERCEQEYFDECNEEEKRYLTKWISEPIPVIAAEKNRLESILNSGPHNLTDKATRWVKDRMEMLKSVLAKCLLDFPSETDCTPRQRQYMNVWKDKGYDETYDELSRLKDLSKRPDVVNDTYVWVTERIEVLSQVKKDENAWKVEL